MIEVGGSEWLPKAPSWHDVCVHEDTTEMIDQAHNSITWDVYIPYESASDQLSISLRTLGTVQYLRQ
jgi:hypothetical protein